MTTDELKELALSACINIATKYTDEEAKRFFPESIREARKIGDKYLELAIKDARTKIKKFTI